jgi:hypothetical protein
MVVLRGHWIAGGWDIGSGGWNIMVVVRRMIGSRRIRVHGWR